MSVLIRGMEMPKSCRTCRMKMNCDDCEGWECVCVPLHQQIGYLDDLLADKRRDDCPLVPVPPHGDLIDRDALITQMERNLWAIEDKAERELGFDETLRRGMQYGHAACLDAVNDATVVFVPQIVHCCECEHNNHCLTQEFVEEESRIPFDKNTWFCADAKVAPTIIPAEEGE